MLLLDEADAVLNVGGEDPGPVAHQPLIEWMLGGLMSDDDQLRTVREEWKTVQHLTGGPRQFVWLPRVVRTIEKLSERRFLAGTTLTHEIALVHWVGGSGSIEFYDSPALRDLLKVDAEGTMVFLPDGFQEPRILKPVKIKSWEASKDRPRPTLTVEFEAL